jgi:hypothetical protein
VVFAVPFSENRGFVFAAVFIPAVGDKSVYDKAANPTVIHFSIDHGVFLHLSRADVQQAATFEGDGGGRQQGSGGEQAEQRFDHGLG